MSGIYDQFLKWIRLKDKNCVVKLPWKEENNTLPDN